MPEPNAVDAQLFRQLETFREYRRAQDAQRAVPPREFMHPVYGLVRYHDEPATIPAPITYTYNTVAVPLPTPPTPEPIEEEKEVGKLANSFLVGCDPEFIVLDAAGKVINVAGVLTPKGEVGYDHNGLVLEARPKPAKAAYTLLKRLQKLMNHEKLATYKDKRWRAGAAYKTILDPPNQRHWGVERLLTLGGHVHLDILPAGHGGDRNIHQDTISALDRLTKHAEVLDILPLSESELRRTEGAKAPDLDAQYGRWGDWRVGGRDYDANGVHQTTARTEYRTPASWLYDQKVTMLMLTGAKLAAVSPQLALDTLKARNPNMENLKTFFEFFQHRDADAARVVEKILNKPLKAQPDRDLKEEWKELSI